QARDLAEGTIRMAENRETGIYHATGPAKPVGIGRRLDGIKAGLQSSATFTWVTDDCLTQHKVEPWSDMPVWTGKESGLARAKIGRALSKGLTFRPLADTARDTLAWFKSLPQDRQSKLRAGLTPEREAEVLNAWKKEKLEPRPYATRARGPQGRGYYMKKLFAKIVDVKPDEVRALLLAFVFNFVVLGGYYVIRPIRDEIGADRGVENLPWMYTGTLIGMLIANALYAAIVTRMSRRQFIPIAYRFAIANLFVFFLLMRWMPAAQERSILAPIFFIWVSVFNLFATTMFWSFMADVFAPEQAKRLFGFIAVGGSIGGIVGGFVTSSLAGKLSTGFFLLITAVMLEIAAQCVRRFPADFRTHDERSEQPIGGKLWEGATHIARSPYLLGLAALLMIYTLTNTWAYFQQADLTQHHLQDRAARTPFLANIDIAVHAI